MTAPLDLNAIRARHAAMAARDWRGGSEVQMHEDIGALLAALDAVTRQRESGGITGRRVRTTSRRPSTASPTR